MTFFQWINCQWVRVTASRAYWASLPHIRHASVLGCVSALGMLPPLPAHVPVVAPVAPGSGDYNPPAIYVPGPLRPTAALPGPFQPAVYVTPGWRAVPIDYRDDSEDVPPPAKVPEPAPLTLFCLGLASLHWLQKRRGRWITRQ